MSSMQTVDCRGQQCPAPILATARAVRQLGSGGGVLEVLADDDAFPLDIESWCRSSGAALVEMVAAGGGHRAVIRVGEPVRTVAPQPPVRRLDCRGMECPQPILEIARAVRADASTPLEVLADDDAFELDVQSWCRSAGATLTSFEKTDGVFHAHVTPAGAAKAPPRPPVPARPMPIAVAAPTPAAIPPRLDEEPIVIDCRGMECPQPILELARAARRHPGALLEVLADDDAFELDVQSWCRTAQAELEHFERVDNTYTARIRPKSASPVVAPAAPLAPVAAAAPVALSGTQIGDGSTFRIDLSVLPPERRISELDRTVAGTRASKLVVIAPDASGTNDILAWATGAGHSLTGLNGTGPVIYELLLARASQAVIPTHVPAGTGLALASAPGAMVVAKKRRATLLVLHNDKEALLAALLVANGAAAQGMDVMLFFTFWGLNLLRGDDANAIHPKEKVSWAQRLFKWLMPKGPKRQGLGKLNFAGVGGGMMASLMRKKNIMDLPELLGAAEEQGIQFVACTMSMNVMGITKRDLHPYDNLAYGGVAAFVESAGEAELSLVF